MTDKPLFGVTNTRDRVINLVVGLVTVLLFGVTLLSAFFAKTPPRGLNIYFVICLSLVSLSHVLLIYWYRQGDLDPKFRLLIYYNAFTMVLLSTCALSFFFTEY
ncbi:transmembrane protein 243 [Nephila pilipes]|uniref:Transmembrane protein 243 n=1 Tax=Nephila pilipes TaxID=299642 RepID=A0A8X6T7Y1_NEPPI|nr:transmembrane protein 243 [Nephila pilipes]